MELKKDQKRFLYSSIVATVFLILLSGIIMSFVHFELRKAAVDPTLKTTETREMIVALSDEIVENATTDLERVKMIASFTDELMTNPQSDLANNPNPNAWHIIQQGMQGYHGDCSKQTIVFAALARSQDFEVRIIGLGGFSHIVVEVKIDGKWILVDPNKLGSFGDNINYYFTSKGEVLSAYNLSKNPDVLPSTSFYGINYFSEIHYDTYNKDNKYLEPEYLYSREWISINTADDDSFKSIYQNEYTGVNYVKSLIIPPFFIRFTLVYNNNPIVFHYDILFIVSSIIIFFISRRKRFKVKNMILLLLGLLITYLVVEMIFWNFYFNSVNLFQ